MNKTQTTVIRILLAAGAGLLFAEAPQWWLERGVLYTNRPAHDFNPVNQGQVKWMGLKAYEEFQEKLPGAANTNILNRIDAFPEGNNFRPANLGMLKAVALPFYERLIAEGYALDFPWTGKETRDYALANQGQLKNLFYFDFDRFIFPADTDGDGMSDALELLGKVYQAIPGDFTWEEAKADAERLGGHLATITSEQEQHILFQMIGYQAFYDHHLWIGAEDLDGDGIWNWVTGEDFVYTRWEISRPLTGANRAAMYNRSYTRNKKGQLWYDAGKNSRYGYIVEYSVTLDPRSSDTDGDGVSDFDEIRAGGNPMLIDTDGDGLSDFDEIHLYGTRPDQPDTDFDGLTDAEEVAGPTDPLNPDCDGDGLLDGAEVYGKVYIPVFEILRWHDAKADAERRGGRLATITSEADQRQLIRCVGATILNRYNFWLGATDENLEGDWRWITGEPLDYTRWRRSGAVMAPDNEGNEDYLELWKGGNDWNDVCGSLYRPYLMEINLPLDPLNPDFDGDGIPDGEEIALGMNPFSPDSSADGLSDSYKITAALYGGLVDSDFDGLSDHDEIYVYGTDPLNPDSDGDGLLDGEEVFITLTDPLSDGSSDPDSSLVLSLPGAQAFGRELLHTSSEYFEEGDDLIIVSLVYDPSVTWALTNSTAGMYRLALQLEPYQKVQYEHYRYPVEISINGNVIGTTLAVTNRGDLAEGFVYTPWLEPGVYEVKCRFLRFFPIALDVRIKSLELYAINGSDTNQSGFPDWVDARLDSGMDTDGDGLSDKDEMLIYGTDHLKADTDGDGLNDADELVLGTDPLERDSDGDGVDDWTEMNQALTDPLVADFGERTDRLVLNGSQIHSSVGNWIKEGSLIYSVGLNGSLTYLIHVPADGHYAVEFEMADRSMFPVNDPFDLTLYTDGLAGRPIAVQVPKGGSAAALFFAPNLTAGEHQFRLEWSNLNSSQLLEVRSIRLVSYAGPDTDGNGRADWIDSREANSFSLKEEVASSPVSPVCIEGSSLFTDLLSISNSFALADSSNRWVRVHKSIQKGWFADAALAPWTETELLFRHNSSADGQSVTVEWEETNLMNTPTNQVTIRKGDALLFNVLPDGENQGSIIITVNGPDGSTNLVSLTDLPVPHLFEEAGIYTVSGFFSRSRAVSFDENDPVNAYGFRNGYAAPGVYNSGNTSTSDVFTVRVEDLHFNGNPSCVKDSERYWDCPNIPEEAVVEQDVALEAARYPLEGGGTRFLLRSSAGAEQYMIARLFSGGPIGDHARINTITKAYSEFYRTIEEFADGSNLIEMTLAFENIPDDFILVLEIFAGGITFLDGTVEKTFTKADFNEQGVLKVLMVQAAGKENNCHRVKIFQGDHQL